MGGLILAAAAVAILVLLAALISRAEPHEAAPPDAGAEPAWWPDFERQFQAYAASRRITPPRPSEGPPLGRREPFGEAGVGGD